MTSVAAQPSGWRVVDIVVASMLAVAFGAVFQLWNLWWNATEFIFPPVRGAVYGVWMLPAVLVPLVVRRPGAALYGETAAAVISMLFGAPWGLLTVVYGLAQGAAAELVFAFGLYRSWRLPVAILAGAAAGVAGALLDLAFFYADWAVNWQLIYSSLVGVSAAVIAGLGSWALVQALAQAGVLNAFAAGREQPEV
ncbi:MAG TPA: ECF transporter S component [Candidatus Limnocylindria bacterium]|jgi:energy-coupling factor transport system substrate-specific component